MKTGWTSLGSAARCPQGRGGWSRGLISCFLHHPRSGHACVSLSLLFATGKNETAKRNRPPLVGQRQRTKSKQGKRGEQGSETERKREREEPIAFPAVLYTYSDCRFKCLLITKLVPQPPRSRSLCIFISTSYGRASKNGAPRFIFICRRWPTVSSLCVALRAPLLR